MSQAARLSSMDARMSRAFLRSGQADSGIYTAKGGTPGTDPNCTVMIDRGVQVLGEFGEVVGHRVVANFLRAEVTPEQGGTLTVGTETWTLEKKTSEDESLSEFVLNG